MKIAMIGHKRIPSREGGVEIVVDKLSTQLVQCQTLYSLALSMGSKIIPGTLADYL